MSRHPAAAHQCGAFCEMHHREVSPMKLTRRALLHLGTSATAFPAISRIASAQTYPSRPVRLIVASAAGGVHDVAARLWADQLKAMLGTIVVDNRGGAGGTLGVIEAARAR